MIEPQQAYDYMGLTAPTSAQQALIATLIELVTAEIEAYCDRVLVQTEIRETGLKYTYYDFDLEILGGFTIRRGSPIVRLAEYPVQDLELFNESEEIDVNNYTIYEDVGIIHGKFNTTKLNLVAEYSGGYETVPKALQLVALEGVKSYFENSGTSTQGNTNIKSKSLDRFSVTYGNANSATGGTGGKTYLNNNQSILNKYKRIDVWG